MKMFIVALLIAISYAQTDRRRNYGGEMNNDGVEINDMHNDMFNNDMHNDLFNNDMHNDLFNNDMHNDMFNNDMGMGYGMGMGSGMGSGMSSGGIVVPAGGMSAGGMSSGGMSVAGGSSSYGGSSSGSMSSGASTAAVTMSASNVFEDGFDLDYRFTGPEEGSQLHYYIREEGCGACSQSEPSLSEILSGEGATCYGSYAGNDEFDHNEHVNCGLSASSQYKLYVARSSTCCDAELVYSGMTMVVQSGHYEMQTGYGTGYGVEAEQVGGGVAVGGGMGMGMGMGGGSGGSGGGSGGSSSSSSSSSGGSGGSDSGGSGGGGDWSDGDEEEGSGGGGDDDDDGIMLQGPSHSLSKSLAPTPTMVLVVVGSVCLGIAAGLLFSCLRKKRALSHEDFYSGLAESGDV